MTFAKIGHIERLKFAEMEMKQHFRQNIGHLAIGFPANDNKHYVLK